MEERRKNIDDLFSIAKTAKVDYPIDKIAAIVGITAVAGASVAAAGTSSIFKLSTMWIALGSVATVVSTVAIINVASSPSVSFEEPIVRTSHHVSVPAPKNEVEELEEILILDELETEKRDPVERLETADPAPILFASRIDPLAPLVSAGPVQTVVDTKQAMSIESFHSIDLNVGIDVKLEKGTDSEVNYSGQESIFNLLALHVENGVLHIGLKKGVERQFQKENARSEFLLVLKMPTLENITINGSGDISCDDLIPTNNLSITINGSGDLAFNSIVPKQLSLTINGSGDVVFRGNGIVEKAEINVNGSGDVNLRNLSMNQVDVNIVGSGDVVVRAIESLKINITGSGDVCYLGTAAANSTVYGSGSVQHCSE